MFINYNILSHNLPSISIKTVFCLVPFLLTDIPEGFIPDNIRNAADAEEKRTWLHDKVALVVDKYINITDTTSTVATGVLATELQPQVSSVHSNVFLYAF